MNGTFLKNPISLNCPLPANRLILVMNEFELYRNGAKWFQDFLYFGLITLTYL